MKRNFQSWILLLVFAMPILFIAFIAGLYFIPCGFDNNCAQASLPDIIHTPIPTIIPATMPVPGTGNASESAQKKCAVNAETLLSAWVDAGAPETDSFQFTDLNNLTCQATFADVQVLFQEGNLWYTGAPACITCHNSNLTAAAANMDLSSYAGVIAGSRRTSANAKGNDILGGGNWSASKLNDMLFVQQKMPFGRPPGAVPVHGPVVLVGTLIGTGAEAATPAAGGDQVARPSNPGGPGEAVTLKGDPAEGEKIYVANCIPCHNTQGQGGILNPGSDDGTVPALNPIDPTLISGNYSTFAYNIDLFIQHGSTPAGSNPTLKMPAWGDENKLTQQNIADVIAYLISLNKK
jgi:mono/diheme cytochrome c family protein